jgi:uncharacterized membrane protein
MDIRALKIQAQDALHRAQGSPRKTVLIHTAVSLGVSLVLALLSSLLDLVISPGGGLGDMNAQAALSTAKVVLQLAGSVAMPFWSAGLVFAALRWLKGERVGFETLAEGFCRFKPVLSSGLLIGVQYIGRAFVSVYLSAMLLMTTPFAGPAYELAMMLEENPQLDPSTVQLEGMTQMYAAAAVIFALVFCVLSLPVYYRYRMVNYVIMDEENVGGLKAMLKSRVLTHRRRRQLLRLYLSFWWYYGLELLLSMISMGAILAELFGVALPMGAEAAHWIFQLVAATGHLALRGWVGPKLELTYALCYQQFLEPRLPFQPREPKAHPWNY